MNVSEYIVKYLKDYGIEHFFGYQGTMIAYFVDAIGREENVFNHVCYNEQGASLAACGYSKSTGQPSVAYSTSGPGAINLIQGIADAYYDSVPILFFTGQLNLSEYTSNSNIRQQGFQETDIVGITKPITKWAVQVKKAEDIIEILPKAIDIIMEGRRGPVLIDLPMDIQKKSLDIDIKTTKIQSSVCVTKQSEVAKVCDLVIDRIKQSKHPVLVLGNGVNIDDRTRNNAKILVEKFRIPTITTMISMDLIDISSAYRYGFLGYAYGQRYANYILNLKADLIVSIGAKLCARQIGLDRKGFAPKAQIIRIDIDEGELGQKVHNDDVNICLDGNMVIEELINRNSSFDFTVWNNTCKEIKTHLFNVDAGKAYREPNEAIDLISDLIPDNSTISCDVGQHQIWVAQSFNVKQNQRILFSGGHGAMGFALPAAIGTSFDDRYYHYCFVGDGSLQMNIQELQWVVCEGIPLKIFVLNNSSLGLIRQQQEGLFNHRYFGATNKYGYKTPNFVKVAKAYGIKSVALNISERMSWNIDFLKSIICDNDAWLIELIMNDKTYAYPKTRFGETMHNQYPYIEESVLIKLSEL